MFYILNNSGEIRYPQENFNIPPENDYRPRLKELYENGFYFYYNQKSGHITSFFKGATGSGDRLVSNQFYAVHYGNEDSPNVFSQFKQRVENAFERQGWQTDESSSGEAAIYTNLSTSKPYKPEELGVDVEVLASLLQDEEYEKPVQLGAPGFASALRVCKSLCKLNVDRVAICTSWDEHVFPETDVVVMPNETNNPGAPTGETERHIEKKHLETQIQNSKSELSEYISQSDDPGVDRHVLVKTLESDLGNLPNINEFGIRINTAGGSQDQASRIRSLSWLIGGSVGIAISTFLILLFGLYPAINELLNTRVHFEWGFIPGFHGRSAPFRASFLIGASLGVLLLAGAGPRALRLTTSYVRRSVINWGPEAGAQGSTDASTTAKNTLRRLEKIKTNPAIDERGGFEKVSREIFDAADIRVSDAESHRRQSLKKAVMPFTFSFVISGILIALFIIAGEVMLEYTLLSLNALLAVALVVAVIRLPVAMKGTAALLAEIPIVFYKRAIYGTIVLLGAWSISTLLVTIAGSEDRGLSEHLISGLAGWIPTMSVAAGTELIFFTLITFLIVGLFFAIWNSKQRFLPAVLLVALLFGVANMWSGLALSLGIWSWSTGILIGVVVGLLVGFVVSGQRMTGTISVFFIALIPIVFIESQIAYTSPLIYDVAAQEFRLASPSISGYIYSSVLQSVVHLLITVLVVFVLSSAINFSISLSVPKGSTFGFKNSLGGLLPGKGKRREVLVIGPDDYGPCNHILLLGNKLLHDNVVPNSGEWMQQASTGKRDFNNAVTPIKCNPKYEGSKWTIWAPISKYALLGDKLFEKLGEREPVNNRMLPENVVGATRDRDLVYGELSRALVESDVLVLLFPATGAPQPDGVSVNDPQLKGSPFWYLECYHNLLEHHVEDDTNVIGVITDTGKLQNTYETNINNEKHWYNFSEVATEEVFVNCPDEMEEKITDDIDNYNMIRPSLITILEDETYDSVTKYEIPEIFKDRW